MPKRVRKLSEKISSYLVFALWSGVGLGPVWSSLFIQVFETKDRFPPSCLDCQLLTGRRLMLQMPKSTDRRSVSPLYPQPFANSSLIKTDRLQFRGKADQWPVDRPDRSCIREEEYKTLWLMLLLCKFILLYLYLTTVNSMWFVFWFLQTECSFRNIWFFS